MRRPPIARGLAGATFLVLVGLAARRAPPDLASAHRAFIAHDLQLAERLYADVAASDTAPTRDRTEALRQLAALAWRFRLDADSGRGWLRRALALGVDSSATLAESARLETASGHAAAALDAAAGALRTARTGEERITGLTRLAAAAVTPSLALLLDAGGWPDSASRSRLRSVLDRVEPVTRAIPGLLEPSQLQLHAALLLDDGAAALSAWRSYYVLHLGRGGPLPAAADTLARVWAGWAGPRATPADRAAAIHALAASGQLDAALILAADPRATRASALTADVVAYARFARRVGALTDDYYRATALREGDADGFRRGLRTEAAALWERLSWPGSAPPFDNGAFIVEARRRFGVEFNVGRTAGYLDLHMGHRVVDEPRVVEQYGLRAELRYLALDGIVSNGFQSWAWDGRAAHGGWANDSTIVQVRPGYASGPLRAWQALTDSVEIERVRTRHAADSVADLERARQNPYAYLPGLEARLYQLAVEALRDSLAASGLTGDTLRAAFLAEYDRARVESSIFAHEGRHAIDRRLDRKFDPWELEYRAKLSEVVFAPRPRLALRGGILNPNIGDDTPHGRANRRIMEELVTWMREHAQGIDGYTPSAPVLTQLSLLDSDQLREAFRSLDPLARQALEP